MPVEGLLTNGEVPKMHCLAVDKKVKGEMSILISSRVITSEVTPTDIHTTRQNQHDK